MLKLSIRLIFSTAALGLTPLMLAAVTPHAQASTASSLGTLQPRKIEDPAQGIGFNEVADNINTQATEAQNAETETIGLNLRELPLIGDLIDDEGNINFGVSAPVSIDFKDFQGSTSLTVGREFSVN